MSEHDDVSSGPPSEDDDFPPTDTDDDSHGPPPEDSLMYEDTTDTSDDDLPDEDPPAESDSELSLQKSTQDDEQKHTADHVSQSNSHKKDAYALSSSVPSSGLSSTRSSVTRHDAEPGQVSVLYIYIYIYNHHPHHPPQTCIYLSIYSILFCSCIYLPFTEKNKQNIHTSCYLSSIYIYIDETHE